jgi:catechol 2,3-dioxygenase-like lactoylglutathione lyase family enzyme
VNALGYLRVMFDVDDLDETLAKIRDHGAQLVDEVVQYEDVYRLCYVRGHPHRAVPADRRERMTVRRVVVDHVRFVVADVDASRRLYTAALAPLG